MAAIESAKSPAAHSKARDSRLPKGRGAAQGSHQRSLLVERAISVPQPIRTRTLNCVGVSPRPALSDDHVPPHGSGAARSGRQGKSAAAERGKPSTLAAASCRHRRLILPFPHVCVTDVLASKCHRCLGTHPGHALEHGHELALGHGHGDEHASRRYFAALGARGVDSTTCTGLPSLVSLPKFSATLSPWFTPLTRRTSCPSSSATTTGR